MYQRRDHNQTTWSCVHGVLNVSLIVSGKSRGWLDALTGSLGSRKGVPVPVGVSGQLLAVTGARSASMFQVRVVARYPTLALCVRSLRGGCKTLTCSPGTGKNMVRVNGVYFGAFGALKYGLKYGGNLPC
jgi:hypothetical protein